MPTPLNRVPLAGEVSSGGGEGVNLSSVWEAGWEWGRETHFRGRELPVQSHFFEEGGGGQCSWTRACKEEKGYRDEVRNIIGIANFTFTIEVLTENLCGLNYGFALTF